MDYEQLERAGKPNGAEIITTVCLSVHGTLNPLPRRVRGRGTNPVDISADVYSQYRWHEIREDQWTVAAIRWGVTVDTDDVGADVLAKLAGVGASVAH